MFKNTKKEYDFGEIFTEGVESYSIDGLSTQINNAINKYSNYKLIDVQYNSVLVSASKSIKHFAIITLQKINK